LTGGDKAGHKQVIKIRDEIRKSTNKRLELEKELARLEARAEFRPEPKEQKSFYSAAHLLALIKSFVDEIKIVVEKDVELLKQSLKGWLDKFDQLFKERKAEEREEVRDESEKIKELNKQIQEATETINKLEKEEDGLLLAEEERNYEFRTQVEDFSKKKNELITIGQEIQDIALVKERLRFKKEELESRWRSLGYSSEELTGISKFEGEKQDWEKTERRIDKIRLELVAIGEIDTDLIKEATETEERYESLDSEIEDLDTASRDLEKLIKNLEERIHKDFKKDFALVNKEFNNYFRLIFGGGKARLKLVLQKRATRDEEGVSGEKAENEKQESLNGKKEAENGGQSELEAGVEIDLDLPRKKITNVEMLSGGERSLVSMSALFALISVSPPPFLMLDEMDAALDEVNSRRFAELIKEFAHKTQFIIVTHNRVTMEVIDDLYGVTMGEDGTSRLLSIRLEEADEYAGD